MTFLKKAIKKISGKLGVAQQAEKEKIDRSNATQHAVKLSPSEWRAELANYCFQMHTDKSESYTFILTGLCHYHPNSCSTCGYGSDAWFYACTENERKGILVFEDNGISTWQFHETTNDEIKQLNESSTFDDWLLFYKYCNNTKLLHPDSISDARKIIRNQHSRTRFLDDSALYGMIPSTPEAIDHIME